MDASVRAEWEPLRQVVVHRPGMEMFFGLLEPYASLYERAFSRLKARKEHERLEDALAYEFNIGVIPFKKTILDAADHDPAVRERLVDLALGSIDFAGDPGEALLAKQDLMRNIPLLDSGHFFNILLLTPAIELRGEKGARAIHLNITEREPLANLHFMRDQQAVTDRGLVLGSMAKPQRRRETLLTGLLWEILGIQVVHRTGLPATFEGGDFMALGDFALVGNGDRTNREGVDQLLGNGLSFDEVGVVHQPVHPLLPGDRADPMIDMHLDTYFNVASSGVAVGSETLLKNAQVDVYTREGEAVYARDPNPTDLYTYITGKGFEVIGITTLEQMAYATNFLCIRDGKILAVEVDQVVKEVIGNLQAGAARDPGRYGELLAQVGKDYRSLKSHGEFFPHKSAVYQHDIDAYPIILENLTGGYGGAHCMTCALKRG